MWEISVCSSVSSGCVLPWCVSGGSEPFGYLSMPTSGRCDLASHLSGVSDVMEIGSARSWPLRTKSTYHQMQYLLSYKPPTLLWAGVRGETRSG
jgi:hypothetical protein